MEKEETMLLVLGIIALGWSVLLSTLSGLGWAGQLILAAVGIAGAAFIWKEENPIGMLQVDFVRGIAGLAISLAFAVNGLALLAPLVGMTFSTSWVIGGIAISSAMLAGVGIVAVLAPEVILGVMKR